MVKTKQIKKTITTDYQMDFGNGITCNYTISNGVLSNYRFKNGEMNLSFVPFDNIDKIRTQHWNTHHKLIGKFDNVEQIENYATYGGLYYLGGHTDGMVKDKNGEVLSSIVKMGVTFSHVYLKIETSKKECSDIIDGLKPECIISSDIEYIEYYNQNDDKEDHYTISLDVLLPDDVYREMLGDKNHVDDLVKRKMFEYLSK